MIPRKGTAQVDRAKISSLQITYIFRRRDPANFSIEKLFDALYAHFEKSGASLSRLELPHVSTGIVSVLRNIWFVARQRKMGILHITGDVHYAALFCPFLKTIITIHDCVALQRGAGFKRFVMWILWFGIPAHVASAITVISNQTRRELLETVRIPERKILIIPNFVDPAFVFIEREYAGDRPRILHIGTTTNKNLRRVIAALRNVPCTLVIVGKLSAAEIEDLRSGHVTFENIVGLGNAAMLGLYRDADIVSFPSTYEGFGLPIIEAQAVGRPVLTSDLEPMRSVAGEGGALFVNPNSVEDIRKGFLMLMNDAALRASLVRAGKANTSRFTLEAVADRYLALYQRLAER